MVHYQLAYKKPLSLHNVYNDPASTISFNKDFNTIANPCPEIAL